MEFYGKIIAVTVQDLTRADDGEAVMSVSSYRHLIERGSCNVLRQGKGLGSYALIEYSSLPLRFRERFEAKYGDPEIIMKREEISLPQDMAAQEFFRTHKLANGESIPEDKQEEYIINARVLNALRDSLNTQKAMRRACNNNTPIIWSNIFAQAEQLREVYNHTLPKSEARLRDKLRQYNKEGYICLVSGKFGNGNTLKITKEAGRQIIALRRSHIPVYTTQQEVLQIHLKMNRQTFTAVYPHQMRPSQYDGAHFICYLNESSAEYKADEEAEPTQGFAYTGTEADGGTLVECDAWNRDKLINGILRTRYLQTEEDAIKTHRLQLLSSKLGMVELSEAKAAEYEAEWEEFEAFRAETIALVDTWGHWE